MKKWWKRLGIAAAVAAIGVAAVAGVALAQEPSGGWEGWVSGLPQQMKEAVAGILGISVEEYESALEKARDQVLDKAVAAGHLTQAQADRIRERMEWRFGPKGGRMWGPGLMMGWAEDSPMAVVAEALGMTADELADQLRDGKTVADLAKERNVDLGAIVDKLVAGQKERLSQAVAEGKITQEQADWMLSRAKEKVQRGLESSFPWGRGRGPRGFWGGGPCWGF